MRYFNHDTNAASDDLVLQLRMEHGGAAIDAYWTILEYIYGEEQPLAFGENRRETKVVMHRLCVGFDTLEKYVKTMVDLGLLLSRKYRDDNYHLISSIRADEAIESYHARAETARQNGKKGGRPRKPNANPDETQSVSSSVSKKNQSEKLTKTKTKRVGFDKQNQTLPARADALEGAPSGGRMKCIRCGSTVHRDGEMWHCPRCMTVLPESVEWEPEQEGVACPPEIMEAALAALAGGAR